jgi:hypothetical protein
MQSRKTRAIGIDPEYRASQATNEITLCYPIKRVAGQNYAMRGAKAAGNPITAKIKVVVNPTQ